MKRTMIITGALVAALGTSTAVAAETHRIAAAKSGLKFNKSTVRANPGRVTLTMANPSNLPHAVGIKGKGKGKTVNRGGTSTYTATLKRGTYTFYCPVKGHEAGGMKGKLIVD